MFIALDNNGQRVSIKNATKGNQYFCEECNTPVIIRAKNSLCIRPHFAHKCKSDCWYDHENCMSEWHREWQNKFPENCREVCVSNKDGVKHRADIFIKNTVIEFQHSPITAEEIAKRNNFYLSCGHQVVWVFDATDKIMNSNGDSIDPMQCRENDLCWKRAKRQFVAQMPPHVTIFLQYKTVTSRFPNQETDIMIQLATCSPKNFTFFRTGLYILQDNFLQVFDVLPNSEICSINDINNLTQLFLKYFGPIPNNREFSPEEINMVMQRFESEILQSEVHSRNSEITIRVAVPYILPTRYPTTARQASRYSITHSPPNRRSTTTHFKNRRPPSRRKPK